VSLDPRIQKATASLLINLCEAFGIREDYATLEDGLVSKERLAEGGLFSHFHVDFKQVGKWDVAPWWNAILTEGEAEYV
jgi:hypothetical protein